MFNFALANWNSSSTRSLSWSSLVSLSLPTNLITCYKHWIYQTTYKIKLIRFIIFLYMDISISYMGQMLPIKKLFPFQSQTIHSSATQFLMQSKLNSLQNGRCPFIFDYSTCSSNPPPPTPSPPAISTNSSFPTWVNFHLPILLPYLFTKTSLQSPPTLLSSIPQPFRHTAIFTIPSLDILR